MQQVRVLSTTFAALADPTRRAILARLAQGEASVKDLSAPFEMTQPAISKHLRVLERAGLIEQGRQAQWRPRHLRAEPLRDVADWVDQYRRHWTESFDRLDVYLREVQADEPGPGGGRIMITERFRNDTTTVYSEGTDLVFERTFDAPRERVWQAFTDPERIPRWWGPHGTTTTVVEMDVRVGGAWRYISHAPDREDVVFHGTYLEIEPPERYRWTFLFDVEGVGEMGGPETFTFEDLDGRTKVTSRSHFGSTEEIEGALATGMIQGAVETWDRLAVVIAEAWPSGLDAGEPMAPVGRRTSSGRVRGLRVSDLVATRPKR